MAEGAVRIEVPIAQNFLNTAYSKAGEILGLKQEFSRQLNELAGATEGAMIASSLDRDGEFTKAVQLIHDRLVQMGETLLLHSQQIAAMDRHGASDMGNL